MRNPDPIKTCKDLTLPILPTQDELVHGVERLKGTAKGIDLAAFIMEHRTLVIPATRCIRNIRMSR